MKCVFFLGVAQLLTTTFGRLPPLLMHTLKIVSCLGTQIDEHTIGLLESEPALYPFNKINDLDLAIQEVSCIPKNRLYLNHINISTLFSTRYFIGYIRESCILVPVHTSNIG